MSTVLEEKKEKSKKEWHAFLIGINKDVCLFLWLSLNYSWPQTSRRCLTMIKRKRNGCTSVITTKYSMVLLRDVFVILRNTRVHFDVSLSHPKVKGYKPSYLPLSFLQSQQGGNKVLLISSLPLSHPSSSLPLKFPFFFSLCSMVSHLAIQDFFFFWNWGFWIAFTNYLDINLNGVVRWSSFMDYLQACSFSPRLLNFVTYFCFELLIFFFFCEFFFFFKGIF